MCPYLKMIDIVIVLYIKIMIINFTIAFGFGKFLHFLDITFELLKLLCLAYNKDHR